MGERGGRGMGGMMFGRIIAEGKIAEANPEKFAALEAAREKYEQELAALAKASGVELPPNRDDALRQLRKKAPQEFAAIVKEMESSPREAMQKMRELARKNDVEIFSFPGGRGGRDGRGRPGMDGGAPSRRIDAPKLDDLRKKYPDKMRAYDELRREDPKAAREMLKEIIESDRNGGK